MVKNKIKIFHLAETKFFHLGKKIIKHKWDLIKITCIKPCTFKISCFNRLHLGF